MIQRRLLVIGLTVVLLLGGCGIQAENDARVVQPPPGPYVELTRPPVGATQPGPVPYLLFLIKDGAPHAVTRQADGQPGLASLMNQLAAGPTAAEQDEGIGSALTGADVIGEVTLADGRANVELAIGLDGTGRSDAVLAIAQVVCTLNARSDVSGVLFTQDGEVVAVPRADGALSKGPLTSADYGCSAPR